MANEVRVGLNVTGEQQAKAKLKAVGEQAEKTADQLEEMGTEAAVAGKATDKAGDKFKATGEDLGHLNKEIIQGKKHLRELAEEFDRTGDKSLFKDINSQRRDLRKFENVAKLLVPDVGPEAAKAGANFGQQFMASAGETVSRAGPYLTAGAAAAVAALTPTLGAVVSAAVVGGVGVGGIIGGIALAAQDPRVQSVASEVGETLLSGLQDAARPFVDPLLDALLDVGNAKWADKLAPGFDKLADSIAPLADGLIRFGDEVVDGLAYAFEHAGPLIDIIAMGLPRIGEAIGDVLTVLSSDTDASQIALDNLIEGIATMIEVTGGAIYALSQIAEGLHNVNNALGLVEPKMKLTKATFNQAADAEQNLVKNTEAAEIAMLELDKAIKTVFGRTLNVKEATLGYQQSIDDLVDELTDGKRTLDENTQAGRDNWSAIIDTTKAIENLREANVANGMSMEDANKKYDQQLEDLRKTLISLGYNKEAVNRYIAELKKVPTQAQTEIHLKGIKAALSDIKTLAAAIGAITGYAIINVATNLGSRASGGPVSPGANYIVGENGPELLAMKSGGGGHVYNAGQTRSMLGGGGSPVAYLQPAPNMSSDMTQFAQLMLPYFQVAIAGQGGVVQDVIGTPSR